MYRTGHVGVSLLVFAPLGYLLMAAGMPVAAFVTGAAMCWLTMLPDVDHRLPLVPHRGPTHSLLFAVAVGGVFAVLGSQISPTVVSPSLALPPLAPFGFVVGFVAVVAHLAADALTPSGIPLFWPLSTRRYRFVVARADNPVANYVLFAMGIFAVATLALLSVQ